MLRLVIEGDLQAPADTDFAFLGESEDVPDGELRALLHSSLSMDTAE